MRRFRYRAPRFPVNLLVQVTQLGSTQLVRCREISVDGMLLDVGESYIPHSSGSIQFGNSSLEIPFQVRTRGIDSIGVMFDYKSSEQSEAICRLVSSLSHRRPCMSLVVQMRALESGSH